MNKDEIINSINSNIVNCDIKSLPQNVESLLKVFSIEDSSKAIAQILMNNFTTFKADALAKLMEVIIRSHPNIALINLPENFLFKMINFVGSKDLYDCYMEEAIQPYLKSKSQDDIDNCYMELLGVAETISDYIFEKYRTCVKGMDFNGSFGRYESNASVMLLHEEDYTVLNDTVERYNGIIGRRDILKDLNEKLMA